MTALVINSPRSQQVGVQNAQCDQDIDNDGGLQ
jgi:hypothetical protein